MNKQQNDGSGLRLKQHVIPERPKMISLHTPNKVGSSRSIEHKLAAMEKRHHWRRRWALVLQVLMVVSITFFGSLLGSVLFTEQIWGPYLMAAVLCSLGWIGLILSMRKSGRFQRHLAIRQICRLDLLKHFECQAASLGLGTESSLSSAMVAEKVLQSSDNDESDEVFSKTEMGAAGAVETIRLWYRCLDKEGRAITRLATLRVLWWAKALAVSVGICVLMAATFSERISASAHRSLYWLPGASGADSLVIVEGAADPLRPLSYGLSTSSPPWIQVFDHHFLTLTLRSKPVRGGASVRMHRWFPESIEEENVRQNMAKKSTPLSAFFKGKSRYLGEPYQAFVTETMNDTSLLSEGKNSPRSYEHLSFRAAKNSALFVDAISKTKPVAFISLGSPSVPEVGLLWNGAPSESISDHETLSLRLSAVSPFPLVRLNLVIQTQRGEFVETVTRILAADQLSIVHNFPTVLAPYITSDEEHIHLYGEAISMDQTQELVGRSEPLALTVVSSYGRYQRTLSALKETRSLTLSWQDTSSAERLEELKALIKSESAATPFFHSHDRRVMAEITSMMVASQMENSSFRQDLARQITEFLELHEAIDDRERDRDFFVAARAYSRKVSGGKDLSLAGDAEGIKEFLQAREARWLERAKKLQALTGQSSFREENSSVLEESAFSKRWDRLHQKIMEEDSLADSGTEEGREELAAMVAEYRQWLSKLESAESRAKENHRLVRSQSLMKASKALKDLQSKQDRIAARLDPLGMSSAGSKGGDQRQSGQSQAGQWPDIKADQIAAAEQGAEIQKMLQNVKNLSTDRLDQAAEAMAAVVESGDQSDFERAEIMADKASRLLREGRQEARKQQQSGRKRDQDPRKSPIGDGFYGPSIVDLQTEREHVVDDTYRGAVLRQLRQNSGGEESKEDPAVQRRYLREVLR